MLRTRSPKIVNDLLRLVARYGPVLFFLEMATIVILAYQSKGAIIPVSHAFSGIAHAVLSAFATKLLIDLIATRVRRSRPFVNYHYHPLVDKNQNDPSFPSNHAGGAFALATPLMAYFLTIPSIAWISLVLAILVSYSRLYAGLHYVTDVVAGALIGVMVSVVICTML